MKEGQSAVDKGWKELCNDGLVNEEDDISAICEKLSIDPAVPACSPTELRVKMVRAKLEKARKEQYKAKDRRFKYRFLVRELKQLQSQLVGQEAVAAWAKAQIPLAKREQEAALKEELAGQLFEQENLNGDGD